MSRVAALLKAVLFDKETVLTYGFDSSNLRVLTFDGQHISSVFGKKVIVSIYSTPEKETDIVLAKKYYSGTSQLVSTEGVMPLFYKVKISFDFPDGSPRITLNSWINWNRDEVKDTRNMLVRYFKVSDKFLDTVTFHPKYVVGVANNDIEISIEDGNYITELLIAKIDMDKAIGIEKTAKFNQEKMDLRYKKYLGDGE